MYQTLQRWGRRYSPAAMAALAAFLLGVHDALAVDLNLDSGIDEAGSEIKRYLRKGLQLFSLVATVVGIAIFAFKLNKKDNEAVWYGVGVIAAAGVFIMAGALLG
jgi:hypothetical protein